MRDEGEIEFSLMLAQFRGAVADCGLGPREMVEVVGITSDAWREFERSSCPRCLGVQPERRMRMFVELVTLMANVIRPNDVARWLLAPDPALNGAVPLRIITRRPDGLPNLLSLVRDAVGSAT